MFSNFGYSHLLSFELPMTRQQYILLAVLFLNAECLLALTAPQLRFSVADATFNVSNSVTKTIAKWTDSQGRIYSQEDPMMQPNLVTSSNSKGALAFIPKSISQSKLLTGRFVHPWPQIQIVTLLSIFERNEVPATIPFTFYTAHGDALTFQFEYDTKCFGFYWRDRGVKLCDAQFVVNSVNSAEYNAALVFASISKNLISLQVGDLYVHDVLVDSFSGLDGGLMIGGSPYVLSPFYGVLHSIDVYSHQLEDFEKHFINMQLKTDYKLNNNSDWRCYLGDATYAHGCANLFRYAGHEVREASSAEFTLKDISALSTSASLCVAHNSSQERHWEHNDELGRMLVLNRHWKFGYVPGSAGPGTISVTVDMSDHNTTATLKLCYKETPSHTCTLIAPAADKTFEFVPQTGYYYLALATQCSVASDCAALDLFATNRTCNLACYQQTCYCMPAVPVNDDTVALQFGVWLYPLAILASFIVLTGVVGLKWWYKRRRAVHSTVEINDLE